MQLEASMLGFSYSESAEKVEPIVSLSCTIPSGSRVALLGPTGSGKSTTLSLLAGLLKPSVGTIRYDGSEARTQTEWHDLRSKIGIALQQPEHQFFAATVWSEVQFAPCNYGVPIRDARHLSEQALAQVFLDAKTYGPKSPFSLSGGEQRRVALASVLVMRPSLLLLDEPLTGMDALSAHQAWQGVMEYLDSCTCTCIVATHDYEWAWSWADYLLVLHAGRLLFSGPRKDYKACEHEVAMYDCQTPLQRLRRRLCASGWHLTPRGDSPEALAEAVSTHIGMIRP
jgi:energy-coupling factor transporter ATP-binding protein EcfA2